MQVEKMTTAASILLAAVLCSTYVASTTGGINATHATTQHQQQAPRRDDPENTDCSDAAIERQLSSLFCDPRYVQPLVDELASCGSADALSIVDNCRRLPSGVYCSDIADTVQALTREASEQCRDGGEGCSADCRRALEDLATQAGCCANGTVVAETGHDLRVDLDPDAWTRCRVPNPGVCPSTLNVSEVNAMDCSGDDISHAYMKHIDCGSPYYNIVGRCNPYYLDFKRHYCAVDENNVACYNHIEGHGGTEQLKKINVICNDSELCSPQCQGLLETIKGTFSCCINFYNTSMSLSPEERFIFSHEFWTLCKVETPGECRTSSPLKGIL